MARPRDPRGPGAAQPAARDLRAHHAGGAPRRLRDRQLTLAELDDRALRAARTWGHTPGRERVVRAFSHLGEHGAIWLAGGLRGGAWRRAARTVALAYLANQLVKLAVPRARPRLEGLPPLIRTGSDRSFPSAHATTSFAGARAYARLGVPAAPLYALAVGLAASRVWLGVHHPSDVLAGAVLGSVVAR